MHTAEETLAAAQNWDARSYEVAPTHPGEDGEWWVADAEHNTFGIGTWTGESTIEFRFYKP